MRPSRHARIVMTLALLMIVTACSTAPRAPSWALPSAAESQSEAQGSWIEIDSYWDRQSGPVDLRGELIAVTADSIHVLGPSGLESVRISSIGEARLIMYDCGDMVTAWVSLGTLSSVSHGFGLVLSLPVWAIVSAVSTRSVGSEARIERMESPGVFWEEIRAFARFPQGMPAGLDRTSLQLVSKASPPRYGRHGPFSPE